MKTTQNIFSNKNDFFIRASAIIFLICFAAGVNAGLMAQKVVKTSIPVAYKGRIAAGDSIIAFGTGFVNGVEYMRPGDTAARKIPGGDQFSSKFFAVAGDKIILANPQTFTVSVFDASSEKMHDIPESTLKLRHIKGGMYEGGGIMSSGAYAVVLTDTGGLDDSAFKVIDASGAGEPRIIGFDGTGVRRSNQEVFKQVAIDAKTGKVAAAKINRTSDNEEISIRIYDFKNPDADPKIIDLAKYKGVDERQMRFDSGQILFHTDENYARAILLDAESGKITELSRAVHAMALAGGTYVYFAERDSDDNLGIIARAAVGGGAAQPKFTLGKTGIGGTPSNGVIGFGASTAVTPDGKQIFIAGTEDVGRTERLQIYRAGKFAPLADASEKPAFLRASDVVASSSIVAFKVGADNQTKIGYIKLK
jgi:hypothetical protein